MGRTKRRYREPAGNGSSVLRAKGNSMIFHARFETGTSRMRSIGDRFDFARDQTHHACSPDERFKQIPDILLSLDNYGKFSRRQPCAVKGAQATEEARKHAHGRVI